MNLPDRNPETEDYDGLREFLGLAIPVEFGVGFVSGLLFALMLYGIIR